MNPTQNSHEINVGHTAFITAAGAWDKTQSERAAQLPALISETGVRTVRVVYSDQHGLMRGKALSVENFLLALHNGVAETVANPGKDTANHLVVPLFDKDGGVGVEQMGGGDMLLAPSRHALPLTVTPVPADASPAPVPG